MPLYDFSSGLAGLNAGIDNFSTALGNADKQNQLRQLGQKMSTGDYDGASVIAASLNDLPTMMKLQDLKQQGANRSDYQSRYVGPQPVGLESLATSAPAPAASLPSSSASPPTPSATPVGGISPLAPKAAQQFMSNGTITNPLGAAALAAGFQTESHYDPSQTAKGDGSDGSDSVNIGQWNGSRAIDFRNFYQANKLDPSDPQTGLAFSKYELQNKPEYAGVVQGLNAATTPEEANAAALGSRLN